MPAEGFILNATYQMEGEVPVVHLYGVLRDGGGFLVRDRQQRARFYIRSHDRDQARAVLAGGGSLAASECTTLQGEAVDRVEVPRPQDAPAARGRLQRAGVSTFEADVRFAYRYLIDRGVRSSVRIEGERTSVPVLAAAYDQPQLTPGTWTPQLRVLSVDIETDPYEERLWAIALHGCGAEEVLLVGHGQAANEAELLHRFCTRVRELDPDVLVGWNVIDFDFPVLLRRAANVGMALELGRGPGRTRQRDDASGRHFSDSVFIPGRVVMDGIRLLRGVSVRLEDYTLDTAAREILGEGKTHSGPGHLEFIARTYRVEPEVFVEYALTDARLVSEIIEKLRLVEFAVERSALTGLPPDRIGASIAAFDFLYLSRLGPRGLVAPTVWASEGESSTSADTAAASGEVVATQGGHVLASSPGLYDDVLLFDFRSLYPSVIRTFQIDPVGLLAPTAAEDAIVAPNGARFRRQTGILTELLDELFASRAEAVAAGNVVAGNAIKILMNSFYGVLGTPACRFHNPEIANAITGFGRQLLLWARDWMEQQAGLEVLYGDTDSLFVRAKVDGGLDEDAGRELAGRINRELAAFVEREWRVPSRLELEFEAHYERFFIPAVRGGKRGATKRYVAMRGGELEFTGMEVVRRDWTDLAHEVQRELYRRLFAGEPMEEYLRGIVAEVSAGRRDSQLVYRKSLRKASGEYRAVPPHVVAARKLQAAAENRRAERAESGRRGPERPDPDAAGMRGIIDYYITVEGPEPAAQRQSALDYEHYISRQIEPIAEPVLATQRITFDEVRRNERQLELF